MTAQSDQTDGSNGLSDASKRGLSTVLGKYKLIAELGSGGMANVYLAVMRGPSGFNKLVVVKVLRPELSQDPEVVAMFHAEARLSARLNHPNVVQTNEVGEDSGHHMIVMEYLDGVAFNQLIDRARRRGPALSLGLHLRILCEAFVGLHYAHMLTDFEGKPLELVHRDVSPHNIFVTFDGQVKVLDFGIAKVASSTHDTRTGVIKGKIRYMAPEQYAGERVDRRSDIFAAGVMLWEAATGEKLWKGRNDVETMNRVVNGDVPSPRDVVPTANETLDRICRKALSVQREDRYSTCLELQTEVEKLLEELGDRSGVRDIAKTTIELFEDFRGERKKMIEAQLRGTDPLATSERAIIVIPQGGSLAALPPLPAYSSASMPPERTPSGAKEPKATARSVPPARATGTKLVLPLAIVAAVIVTGTIAFLLGRPAHESPAAASAVPPSAKTPASTAAAASTSVAPNDSVATTTAIKVRTEPTDAKLFLDGKPLPSNPIKVSLARDGATHELRAEAFGYATKVFIVSADSGSEIVMSLDRLAKTPSGYAPTKPVATATTTSTATTTPTTTSTAAPGEPKPATSTKKPPKPIDSANPWD